MAAGAEPPKVADGTGRPPEDVAFQKGPFRPVPDPTAAPRCRSRRAEAAIAALARHAFLTCLAVSARFRSRSIGCALV